VARAAAEQAAAEETARVAREVEERRVAAERAAQAQRDQIQHEAREAAEAAERERVRVEVQRVAAEERAARLAAKEEAARVNQRKALLAEIRGYLSWTSAPSAKISEAIAAVVEFAPPDTLIDWEEFTEEATSLCHEVQFQLESAFEAAETRESAEAERQRLLAEQNAENARLDAVLAERRRRDAEIAEAERQAKLREADKANRRKINREIVDDLIGAALSEDQAILAMKALVSGKVRNIHVEY
jgi:hypothetical protein